MKNKKVAILLACGLVMSLNTAVMAETVDTVDTVSETEEAKLSPSTETRPTKGELEKEDGTTETVTDEVELAQKFPITQNNESMGIQKEQTYSKGFEVGFPQGYTSATLQAYIPGVQEGTTVYLWQKVGGEWIQIEGKVVAANTVEFTIKEAGVINIYIDKVGDFVEVDGKQVFKYNDETTAQNEWVKTKDGKTVRVGEDGTVATGWLDDAGTWYLLAEDGTKETGWKDVAGTWYYMDQNSGVMKTGWLDDNGTWYNLGTSGAMKTGWYVDGATWYYSNGSGVMKTGWLNENGTWYYLGGSGAMSTGWFVDGATWYYSNGSGVMQTGWLNGNGTWYYLGTSGAMSTGWINDGATWYYMGASGAMQTGWVLDGADWYYLDASGRMATGWVEVNKRWYYLNASGRMQTGTIQEGGKSYFLIPPTGEWDGVTR